MSLLRNDPPPLFRPPAEAESVIVRVAFGCPHPACAFCGMYRSGPYRPRDAADVSAEIRAAAREQPGARRVFLADGDALRLGFDRLAAVLGELAAAFPALARVNSYANGSSILALGREGLASLRARRLDTLYMGLESGDPAVLRRMGKAETVDGMVEAGRLAREAGLKMSVIVLLGLGGPDGSAAHARATAEALNRMQPRLLSALRVIPVPGTPLARWEEEGAFRRLSEFEAVRELRDLAAALTLEGTVFRANHVSNVLPVEARFPRDRAVLLASLDALLDSGRLDATRPAPRPPWL
ncbi:MAG: radical SAM protein [Lentisphaerae bacterium]|nr:radical SAM protein [Lentisphaerota bacterium]